jgi:DNA-directed RNA polymerase subunit H (RpoH/RPB5)
MDFGNLEPSVADILLRSRQTTLDILDDRGYDTTPYRNIAPDQILTLASKNSRALDIVVKRRTAAAPCERAYVLYTLQQPIRSRLSTFTRDIYDEKDGPKHGDDIIVILNEPYNEAFDKTSLQMWQQKKERMTFFHLKQVVVHLGRHSLVPPHRKLTSEESKSEMSRLYLNQKSQLPLIKHSDIQSRIMGLVPGDIVEILRPSPTAGIARILRICAA